MKLIDFHERFARTMVAGFAASIILSVLNLFSYYVLHFSNRRFINYAAIMIFGRKFSNLTEAVISSIAQIGYATCLFIILSYLVLKKDRQNNIWRGLFIGFGTWYAIMSLNYIIGIHKILPITIGSAISLMVTSSIWGILGAWFLHKLDKQYGTQTEIQQENEKNRNYYKHPAHAAPAPAMKKKLK